MNSHGDTERFIRSLFAKQKVFEFNNEYFSIEKIGKPCPPVGECKTDVYILAQNIKKKQKKEFKISIKKSNADFLENKITAQRALEIFGKNYQDIIIESIKSVKEEFENDYLIYFKKYRRTSEKCIKIGWKFELLNRSGGKRSGKLLLNNSQKIDVYSGTNLIQQKKDSLINGEVIPNSGVANYLLVVDRYENNLDYYIQRMIPIEEFAIQSDIYFACKAINYRSYKDKWDGNRPLSVYVDWSLSKRKISAKLIMDKPLDVRANFVGNKVQQILHELNINQNNFDDLKNHLDSSVNYF